MDDIEYQLLYLPDCLVYEVPPAARSTGHMAEEWKNCILQGKVKIMAKGQYCYIQLLSKDGALFVACQVDPMCIEHSVTRTRDSSRYFVLTVVSPTGSRAYIGMGFTERNDAFDFWAALLDFSERVKNEKSPAAQPPPPDLSHLQLREGQTFSLSGKSPANPTKEPGKLMKLRPPPK